MQNQFVHVVRRSALAVLAGLLAASTSCAMGDRSSSSLSSPARSPSVAQAPIANVAGTAIALTAQRTSATLPDGKVVPMWGFCATPPCAAWAPGPKIVANATEQLQITLTNSLPVPTSLVILGQIGTDSGKPTLMDSPVHTGQNFSTFPGNADQRASHCSGAPATACAADADCATPQTCVPDSGPVLQPPKQGKRVRSFGAETPAGGSWTYTWNNLKPGTYLYETGTLAPLQVPMGLYGVLVVKDPAHPYDDEASLLFSEIDAVQNGAVDAAALFQAANPSLDITNLRFNDPACGTTCFPAAVNYTPTYFLINGSAFDKTAPDASSVAIADGMTATNGLLVRLLNAGSRTHIPALVGTPMAVVAEDGNRLPGKPRIQSEVLLTAGKTHDVVLQPVAAGMLYPSATYPLFDRALSLSAGSLPNSGMQAFLLVNHAGAATNASLPGTCAGAPATVCTAATDCAAGSVCNFPPVPGQPGNLPAAVVPQAVNDAFGVPYATPISGNVLTNDTAVVSAAVVASPTKGTLTFNPDGSFTYAPASTVNTAGDTDSFTYNGNGGKTNTATVTLTIGAQFTDKPTANNDSYSSKSATTFSAQWPGVLANDVDVHKLPLTAGGLANPSTGACGSVTLNPDGSFTATNATPPAASCSFTYTATNSQGAASAAATVTVTFPVLVGGRAGLAVNVVDATDPTSAISDYRWTIQEDLTFKHDVNGTPALNTRTVGTSFHRSHMPVVATGCVGPTSCGSGQTVRGVAVAANPETSPSTVLLDPAKRYYISILPGDGSPPGHAMGGAEIKATAGVWPTLTIRLEATPLPTAQMSIYIYEDNSPTNGASEPTENGLGGFNIILMDPAGRPGDVAGQQSYDAFNMPLSNYLLGSPGCPDELNKATNGTATTPDGNLVGAVYTCPSPPPDYTGDPAVYALAGHALIKNLTPARYDVIAHPAAAREAAGEIWWQTETLEGTAAQDAFVGVNEPRYFQEFGPPGPHVTIGFVNPSNVAAAGAATTGIRGPHSITGKVTSQHMSHPSDVTLYDSGSYELLNSTTCYVVVNSQGGDGPAVASAVCDADGNFTVGGLAAGDYDVAIFDKWLDQIIQNVAVTLPIPAGTYGAGCPAGSMCNIPVLSWFTQHDQNIFLDNNKNGIYDDGDTGISNVPLYVRYRTGAPALTTLSDSIGNGILVEMFPLFNWYVAEADTTRFKQTGVTISVDGGGPLAGGNAISTPTYATGEPSITTTLGGAQTYGIQSFISQRNRIDWGRTPYVAGENGGIVGTVVYSSTRPFDDMRLNVQTIWEPLVPRVTVNLYKKATLADGSETLQLVDTAQTTSFDDFVNLVYDASCQDSPTASTTCTKYLLGSDGTLRNPTTGTLVAGGTAGRQVNMQCPGQKPDDKFVAFTLGAADVKRCYDGWHDWNQVQAAPYDGRYAFPSEAYKAAHALTAAQTAAGQTLVSLPTGKYVVEVITPAGYEVVKEEDKNILIGDAFVAPVTQQFGPLASIFILPDQATLGNANVYNPGTGDPGFQTNPTTNNGWFNLSTGGTFPECVGAMHRVPDFLSLYPQAQQVAPFAGMDRPLCDRKQVVLGDQMQASAAFFIFTETPVASNNTGIILDDASSEFNAAAPDFGEKASVPFVPVSVKDFRGIEIQRTYSDQWGAYNMMTPSSWLVNPPTPSGYGPNMLIACINDPGPIQDPATGLLITDPHYNPAYSNFCYTNPYMPGQTTYLDTPVLPIAAFASGYNPPDCALPDSTPAIKRVDSSSGFGPWLPSAGGTLTITAQGDLEVPNPAYAGPFAAAGLASKHTITRHYGFGATKGRLLIGGVDLTNNVAAGAWTDQKITVTVPAGTPTGELSILTSGGQASVDTVTVTLGGTTPTRVSAAQGQKIQAAIDAASPGDLLLLDAGTYNELLVMWKPIRLQGVGAGSVIINAAKYPNAKLEAWRSYINPLFAIDTVTGNQLGTAQVDPLPTQEITGGIVLLEPTVLGSEEGAGITVLAKNLPNVGGRPVCAGGAQSTYGHPVTESNFLCQPSRIDGLSVTGGDSGGGVYVNGWAHNLEISNNRVYGNAGAYNGGIRVGVPYLELEALPTDSQNRIVGLGYDTNVKIHHNAITKNGTVEAPLGNGGAGGGVSICAGSDKYSVDHNYICGNYSSADGGGIGHLGFSQGGTIANNQVLFNQSFQQTAPTHGGGIFVGGEPAVAGTLSLGTGDVTIDANLIRGNFAEAGQGGGIRLQQVNGADVAATVGVENGNARPAQWHAVTVTNNMIVNNVAGWAGGGISLADTLRATIDNNTVANNDTAGIAGVVLSPAGPNQTSGVGRPAASGIVSEPTSGQLTAQLSALRQLTGNGISQPVALANNIIWQNRSFYYSGDGKLCAGNSVPVGSSCTVLADQTATGQCPSGAAYWEVGVLGDTSPAPAARHLNPTYTVMTDPNHYPSAHNTSGDPNLSDPYCNGSRVVPELGGVVNPPSVLNLQVAATVDEGNNYVNMRYGPLYVQNPSSGATFGDYHIKTGSSAINTGLTIAAVTLDFDGDTRPAGAYDIGADELVVRVVADLSITKTDNVSGIALRGGAVTYTIRVTNAGPDAATGAVVTDTRPTALSGWVWTCTGAGCGTTGNTGTGNINKTLGTLAAGASATFSVVGIVSNSAAFAPFANTAAVTAPGTVNDPNTANNSATDNVTVTRPLATVGFTWTNGGTVGAWGAATGARTITVRNTGPANSQLSLSGVPAVTGTQFARTGGNCSATSVLGQNQTCTVIITRTRPGAAPFAGTGNLTITDTGAASPTQVQGLTGN